MLEIDGSQGEGGGQVLRTTLALSILTGQPVHVSRVRAGRRKPGLAPQHLAGVIAAARICGAKIGGATIGSTEITFEPGGATLAGNYFFDISQLAGRGSAGAVTLLLQSILLPLALAGGPSKLGIRGGTHVPWSPSVHYLEHVLLPTLARMGLAASIELVHWGWYPGGGGEVLVRIEGKARLKGIDLTWRGQPQHISGLAAASNLPSHIPQRIADRANNRLKEAGLQTGVQPLRDSGPGLGVGISVAAEYENSRAGFSALGEKGKPSEAVADEALDELLAYHQQGSALDPHLPDQLLLALALADGPSALSTTRITRHTLTNMAVIGHFLPRQISAEGEIGQPGMVRVAG